MEDGGPARDTRSPDGSGVLAEFEQALATPELLDAPRAILLLRLCLAAQVFRPDLAGRYWQDLKRLERSLPLDRREAYEGLKSSFEPPAQQTAGGFVGDLLSEIDAAAALARDNPALARARYRECETKLRKAWWRFGRGPAWIRLVQTWAETDRPAALKLIGRVPAGVRQNLLSRLNDESPIAPEHWDIADSHAGVFTDIVPVILGMLDRQTPRLTLSPALTAKVGAQLRGQVHALPVGEETHALEAEREKALDRYVRLVGCALDAAPAVAESLLEELFAASVSTTRFGQKWPERMTFLRQLLNTWVGLEPLRERGLAHLEHRVPPHLRDFCLTQWHAMLPASAQEVPSTWKALGAKVTDQTVAEQWFLVTVLRRGFGEAAMQLANASPNSGDLVPRLRRAWLCEHPETASGAVRREDLQGDLIGQFLWFGSNTERAAFLRESTNNGAAPVPKEMWEKPDLFRVLTGKSSDEGSPARDSLLRLYTRTEAQANHFAEYVRLQGYGQYGYEDLDPFLRATLVAWDEVHPDECSHVVASMWDTMRPETHVLMNDVVRNAIFERCRAVLCARPRQFADVFVSWVKKTLVDRSITNTVGQTTYTLSLNSSAPFLFCLLGAQNLASAAPGRCDELLTCALEAYTANADLMSAAARLYSSDKGLRALAPPVPLKDEGLKSAWQMGVVDASVDRIINSLLAAAALAAASSTGD